MSPENFDDLDSSMEELRIFEDAYSVKHIIQESRYSKAITAYISNLQELRYYQDKLNLQEGNVTRPCLKREFIDAMMRSKDGEYNYELMAKGRPPVTAFYGEDSLELHHIRQEYKGPFAELTPTQHRHADAGVVLHPLGDKKESWRSDKEKCDAFNKERARYWKKRSKEIDGQQYLLPLERSQLRRRGHKLI